MDQDLREYIDGGESTQFHVIPTSADNIYSDHHRQEYHVSFLCHDQDINHDDALMLPVPPQITNQMLHHDLVRSDHLGASPSSSYGLDIAGAGEGRWPRQETLTLLQIRSSLDFKFKQANHKAPLWDQVSRIMASEHGYYRNGKKCKEKFENLYKYYKKTKDGKIGKKQQGNSYRFFRQLESLYGETDQIIPSSVTLAHQEIQSKKQTFHHNNDNILTISNSSDGLQRGYLKDEVMSLIELQMRKLMEKQEEWLAKVLKIIERKEQERVLKEEEWRMHETARVEKECEFWARERAWIKARDVALMEAFKRITQGGETN